MGQIQYSFNPQEVNELKDLFDLLHRYYPDIPANPQEIFKVEERIKEYQTKNSDLEQKTKDAEENSKKAKDDVEQLSQQVKDKEKEIASLNKQIADFEKRLAAYEPSLSDDTGGNKFFKIDGTNLSETMDDKAPFIGKVDPKGNAVFTFNVEKGEHKYFSQNSSKLESFCEIIDHIDGANHIELGEWGKGEFKRELLTVTEKAKIKLTRD